MDSEIRQNAKKHMEESIEALKKDYAAIRTGRASLALLDHINVDYYGTSTKLNQAASLSLPDSRTIMIQPWDPKIVQDIEKAIMKSDLDLTPSNDGKVVRINIPTLTEERRKDLVKVVKKRAEVAKVSVRNHRRETNEALKKLEKDKEISEDDLKKSLDEIQKLTDEFVKNVDATVAHKEEEIMEV
ncbi:MAG: ribosome recycling factor [Thermodesulfovibrionales bacterium]|nr:ribosome recycling factor [Thermodesulfovibrionales bacterium]